jgi:hypothetical protein
MDRGLGRRTPALAIATIALFAALGGSVYAATQIDGRTVAPNSLPGNRVRIGSLPPNRLQVGSVPGDRLTPGTVTGVEVDASTLDQVPEAAHAESADSARRAETAASADSAESLDGREAGCAPGTRFFAGACWQTVNSENPATAPAAAADCASHGGELPDALTLVAFSKQPGIKLAPESEWSGDVTNVSGTNVYGVVTISATGAVDSAISTAAKHYRCVIPLVS